MVSSSSPLWLNTAGDEERLDILTLIPIASKLNDLDRQKDLLEKVKSEVEAKGRWKEWSTQWGEMDFEQAIVFPQKPLLINPFVIATGRRSIVSCADVTNDEEVSAMIAKTVDQLGELNVSMLSGLSFRPHNMDFYQLTSIGNGQVFVANAGIVIPNSLVETTTAQFTQVLNVRFELTFTWSSVKVFCTPTKPANR